MRKSFVILYSGNHRRLQSDTDRTIGAERLAFEELKRKGLPKGIDRAEYHDSDLRGSFLTVGGIDRQAAHVEKQKKIASAAEKRRAERLAAEAAARAERAKKKPAPKKKPGESGSETKKKE